MKYIHTQLMSRDASRATTKSKIELSARKDNGESLTFVTENPMTDSKGVLDTPLDNFQNILKI